MKTLISVSLFSALILSSCGQAVEQVQPEKTPFQVKAVSKDTLVPTLSQEKTGRITASSTLTLTAQGAGEISKVTIKEGQFVKAGTVIATLKDTQNNYDLRLEQAENALKTQDASITTTRINLESAVDNARIALERAQQAYETLTGKNALQYDTVVNTNAKTLKAYNENYKTYLTDVEKNMTQVLYEGDRIMGMTSAFQYTVDGWKSYLGAKVGNARAESENAWNKLYALRGDIRSRIEKGVTINLANPKDDFDLIAKGYEQTRKYTDTMIYMLQNNFVGGGLSQAMQDGWIVSWNGFRSAIGGAENGFSAWRSQTLTFLDGYKNTELATNLAVAVQSRPLTTEENTLLQNDSDLRITYENLKLTLSDQIKSAKLSIEQAQTGYENAKSILQATLVQLEASKKNAEISLEQAKRDYAKLRVTAPVSGNIGKVIANVGQSVTIGSPIAEFTSNQPQISVDIDTALAETLNVGENVDILGDDFTLSGTITALSRVAGANLLSPVRISVNGGEKQIGKSAKVVFAPSDKVIKGRLFVPLSAVKIISEKEGEIAIIGTGNTLEKKTVMLGQVGDTSIEIFTNLEGSTKIVINDISNYDENKNTLIFE